MRWFEFETITWIKKNFGVWVVGGVGGVGALCMVCDVGGVGALCVVWDVGGVGAGICLFESKKISGLGFELVLWM